MLNPWDYAPIDQKTTEHAHQVALFMWSAMAQRFGVQAANFPSCFTKEHLEAARQLQTDAPAMFAERYTPEPRLKWLHAIHNQGHGDAVRGGKARAEGVRSGVADVFLPVPRLVWVSYPADMTATNGMICGFYIELKRLGGKPSKAQEDFQADMRVQGYAVEFAEGWIEARDLILRYLGVGG